MENDHDILIDSRRKIITLCEKVDRLTDKFDKREESCDVCKGSIYERIDDVDKSVFKKDIAMWIIGIIFVAISAIVSYQVIDASQMNANKVKIEHIMKHIE